MAGQIKGITIEFQGNTTKLDKALSKIKSESKSIDKELREVNRALKFNPRNTELLRQKFNLLGQKVDQTEKELKQFRDAERQLKEQKVSKQSAEWQKVRREIIQAESKLKHFNAELRATRYANITNLGNAFKSAGANMRSAGMYASIGAAGMIVTGKKLLEMNATQEQAENKLIEIYKTRMGVNKKYAQSTMEVASALQKQGVVGDEVTLSGAQQLATYAKMPETVNKLLPAMDNLLVQQKGMNATAGDATSIANLFGKAMMGQTGALKRVGISFKEEQEQVLKFGTEEEKAAMLAEVVTQNVGNMNEEFAKTDAGKMEQVKNSLGDFGERLGATLLPALASMAEWLNNSVLPVIEKIVSYLEAHPVIAKVAVALTALLAVGGPLLIFLGGIVSAVGTLMTLIPAITGAFAALSGPIGIVIGIIVGLIAVGVKLYRNWDTIKAAARSFLSSIKSTFAQVKDAIAKPFQDAWNKVKGIWEKIKGLFPLNIGKIFSNFKLPHLKVSGGKAPFGIGGKGSLPHFSVDWYKKAMTQPYLFTKPTIVANGYGDAGAEFVYGRDALMGDIAAAAGVDYERMAAAIVGALYSVNSEVAIVIDGQKLAKVQAPYTNAAVNQLQARQARQLGLIGV